ncbi:MAG TPA: DNA (cytosine-5-)-methyltransferase [Candidatus Pacearchaeota archaeon]|nr:DNA (cytosine-5-)-methyltransferase [Candidatus Pacearchaeota archaeon]
MNDNIYQQMSLFEFVYPTYKIKKPIRLIELFAGYGSQFLALKYLGANVESHKIVEWAIPAILAYKDIHYKNDKTNYAKGLTKNELVNYLYKIGVSSDYEKPMTLQQLNRKSKKCLEAVYNAIKSTHNLVNIKSVAGGDLNIVNTDKYEYILTYSFPCQDLSIAGNRKGMKKGGSTRSGLLWEVERILNELKDNNLELPQILLMENVPQIASSTHSKDFGDWQHALQKLGYKSYCNNLIATDFGIPQTRDRTFMISILGDYFYRFPQPIKLTTRLSDYLESEVDEKYYLSQKQIIGMLKTNFESYKLENKIIDRNGISKTIVKRFDGAPLVVFDKDRRNHKEKLAEIVRYKNYVSWKNKKGEYNTQCNRASLVNENDNALTISTDNIPKIIFTEPLRFRKLTPLECFRLMGVKDDDYSKLRSELSNSQRYCLAGNSIVVNVLMAIFNTIL